MDPQGDLGLTIRGSQVLLPCGQALAVRSGRLIDLDVREDHDGEGTVEAHCAGEHKIPDVLGEWAFPRRSGAFNN